MPAIDTNIPECVVLKKKYEDCFNAAKAFKFTEIKQKLEDCDGVFQNYKDCMTFGLRTRMLNEKNK